LDSLRRLLTDGQFARSGAAASALGHYGEKAVAILAQGVADSRADVAAASASALGHVLTPSQSPHDDNTQSDPRDRHRTAVEKALQLKNTKAEMIRRSHDGKPAIR